MQEVVVAPEELISPPNMNDEHNTCAANFVDEQPDHPAFHSPPPRPRGVTRRMQRALLKPLVMLATSQYFIVTVLAGLTAVTLALAMAKTVSSGLEPIVAALKRF
jgi:hypothetical protein